MATGRMMAALVLAGLSAAVQSERADYAVVADYVGVPEALLYAMALAESGRQHNREFVPWPWTLNIEGEAQFYPDRETMFSALMAALRAKQLRVDVGPLQVNWYWHYERLQSPWRITDPVVNLKVAAQILKQHYQRSGDWLIAAGHYHRPSEATPADLARAQGYRERVSALLDPSWSRVQPQGAPDATP